MRHFLILFNDIPINKASVKAGTNSPEAITAARCVNVGLFISGNLRRDVVISLAKGSPEDLRIISFLGDGLRRVSPDERSISFFLLKAILIAEKQAMDSLEIMDSGIEVRRTSLKKFLDSVSPVRVYLSTPEITSDRVGDAKYDNSILIYSNEMQFDLIQEGSARILEKLPYFQHPERFILDANMITDLKKAS